MSDEIAAVVAASGATIGAGAGVFSLSVGAEPSSPDITCGVTVVG